MFATKLQTFPNRETRVTFYAVPGLKRTSDRITEGRERAVKFLPESVPPDDEAQQAPSLDITSELRDALPEPIPRLKPGFGGKPKPTKFGNTARRRILRSGGSMSTLEGGDKRVLFLTGTLPGSTAKAFDALSRYSSYIVDRLKTWISDNGGSSYAMYVWERQKRGALHLHYAVYVPPNEKGNRLYHGFKQYWYRLLCAVSTKSGVDLFERKKGGTWRNSPKVVQAKAVWCNRSVAAYLSKYLGKRVNQTGVGGRDASYYPVRWWGVSRPLLALLRSQTFEQVYYSMSRRDAQTFYIDVSSWLENTSDKCYSYEHRYTGSAVTVAYNTLNKGEQIWELMRTSRQRASASNTSWECTESITIKLRSIMMRYYLTSKVISQIVSPYCGQIAESAYRLEPLSIIAAMELMHGLLFLLSSKYRDRNNPPKSLSEDQRWLESNLALALEMRRTSRQLPPRKNGIHG